MNGRALEIVKKAAGCKPRGTLRAGERSVGTGSTVNVLAWQLWEKETGQNAYLLDTPDLADLDDSRLRGSVILDLYVYDAKDELTHNIDAFFRDGRFLGCADPFTDVVEYVALMAKIRST